MINLPKYMAISLLRFEKPVPVEKFAENHFATKVRYSTCRADTFRVDGTIAEEADVFSRIALCEEKAVCDEVTDELVHEAKQSEGIAESMQLSLRPYAHRGSINWLDPVNAGLIFEPHQKPPTVSPVVVLTSGGFTAPETQMERVGRTVTNTVMVAENALKANGLTFRRVFSLCANLGDPITFTVWESEDAIANFAYRPGDHLDRVKPQLESTYHFDRTSFTRSTIERAEGEWEGVRL